MLEKKQKHDIDVFISFAYEDEEIMHELAKHLKVLHQLKIINLWHNRMISAGIEREHEIDFHLNKAELILMLISPDFMDSEYCYSIEMKRAMERHQQGEALVIPIILRPVHWQGAPFGKLQALPKDAIPITSEKWHHPDDAFYSVVEGIMEVLGVRNLFDSNPRLPKFTTSSRDRLLADRPIPLSIPVLLKRWWALCVLAGTTFLNKERHFHRVLSIMVVSGIILVVITVLILSPLMMIQFRPAWCPDFLCLSTQARVATHSGRASDQNLDAYFLAQQSTSFELPGALQQYTLQNLPRTIAAVRSDNVQSSTYRLVISVQNLHQTGYEIYIETVTLVVHALPPLADPLNVWDTSSLSYSTAPYDVNYTGQPAGSVLDATFEPNPDLTSVHQRLKPGESDLIGLQIDPAYNLRADLQFQVRITYRMANEGQEHTLTLPNLFEVVFSNASNWHLYRF